MGEEFIFPNLFYSNFDLVFHGWANSVVVFHEAECIINNNNMQDALIQVPNVIREYCNVDQRLEKKDMPKIILPWPIGKIMQQNQIKSARLITIFNLFSLRFQRGVFLTRSTILIQTENELPWE